MSAFKEILASKDRMPQRHVVLQKNAFADDCSVKPLEDLALGIRRCSDDNVQTARAEAAKYATEMHDDREGQIEAYNDALMRWMIVFGTCDTNDVGRMASFFGGSEENVRTSLTSQAIRYVWDEIDRFHVETSPLVQPATDEEISGLCQLLLAGPLHPALSRGQILRIRKLLGFVINELRDATRAEEEIVNAIQKAVMDDG